MTTRHKRLPTHLMDRDGKAITLVPLASGGTAKVFTEDFYRLTAAGFSDQWTANDAGNGYSYVRCARNGATGRLVTVPRLIMAPPRGYVVRYLDGDRTNLRRDNLCLEKGWAKDREACIMSDAASDGSEEHTFTATNQGAPSISTVRTAVLVVGRTA